jgi:hypothetical protein
MLNMVFTAILLLQAAPERALAPSKAHDIITLRDERAQLEAKREALTLQLQDADQTLKDRIARDQVESQLKLLQPKDPNALRLTAQLQYYESRGPWNEANTREALVKRIQDIKREQLDTEKHLGDNIRETYRATMVESDRQEFLNRVSWIFGILVGILVIGFFSVVIRDETVRRSVFQGPAGLQMITLLSVVIAIILFGITGVLEGKELSALLGGLTGYILGRVADRAGKPGE